MTEGLLEVLLSITMVIRDYTANQCKLLLPFSIIFYMMHSYIAILAKNCVDTIKDYLIGMVESWNNDRLNLHSGITSIVDSFGGKKDYKYLSLRCPSNLDSGVATGPSTSSLPRRSQPSRESPLVKEPPSFPPRSKESLRGKSHEFSQDSYVSKSVETLTSLMPLQEPQQPNPSASHCELPSRERRVNPMVIPHSRRSYVFPEPSRRRTSAPWKLISELATQPKPSERHGVNPRRPSAASISATPQNRSRSSVRRPSYAPPLPQRRHSDSVSSGIGASSRFSPQLDRFIEDDEEEIDEEEHYSIIDALDYITPKRFTGCIEGRPDINKLQKKLCKRNNTLKKGRRPSVHRQSLTHSSDASSDDSDTGPKPQRRVSSYHPPRKTSVIKAKPAHRRITTSSFPLGEDTVPKTAESSVVPEQDVVNSHNVQANNDGDNEASEYYEVG